MSYTVFDFLGNVGVFLIVATYLALQLGRMSSGSLYYSALNAVGAVLILISLYFEFNLSAFIVEVFWLVISLYGLAKGYLNRGKIHDSGN